MLYMYVLCYMVEQIVHIHGIYSMHDIQWLLIALILHYVLLRTFMN